MTHEDDLGVEDDDIDPPYDLGVEDDDIDPPYDYDSQEDDSPVYGDADGTHYGSTDEWE